MIFVHFTLAASRPLMRSLPGLVIILIVVLVCARLDQAAALPLALGGWIGNYLVASRRANDNGPRE